MKSKRRLRILFVTPDLGDNSLGRTFALWLAARKLGYECSVVSIRSNKIWEPLRAHSFAQFCSQVSAAELVTHMKHVDLTISVQPLDDSLVLAHHVAASHNLPLLVDIDDPDLASVLFFGSRLRRLTKWVFRYQVMADAQRRMRISRKYPVIVSNPYLQRIHGGTVIPHLRETAELGPVGDRSGINVVFVGTNRPHKGISLLRRAIAELQMTDDFRLTITDAPPSDPQPWESWIGAVPFDSAMKIVGQADIVVIPSLSTPFAFGQLPAKLIDAMLLARPTVVSDIEPMPWAIGDGGLKVRPGDLEELKEALLHLTDPRIRQQLGETARERALAMFTLDANVNSFAHAVENTISVHAARS